MNREIRRSRLSGAGMGGSGWLRKATAAAFLFAAAGYLCAFTGQEVGARGSAEEATEKRVEAILRQMTLDEKIGMLGGVEGFFTREVQRLGVPRLKMADGPLGVRNYGQATTMAGGIALAATWDMHLAERVGTEIGRDARARGVHFLLGPGVNLYRAPMNGRNFEYFGEDPWLSSRMAVAYIEGMQKQGVSATIKHYLGNNSEFDRHNTDSVIDERTLREIYMPVFEAAVKEARVGAVMASYNLTNGQHMTQNARLDREILKTDWGFDGVLMSDWGATYDGVAAANAGLDLEMPRARWMTREVLESALKAGTVSQATIDDKVRRILRVAVRFGWLDREQTDATIPRENPQGREAALDAAREGMVLLKNQGNVLPLAKARIKSIAVIGPDADPAVTTGGGSARVRPFAAVSYLEGIRSSLGDAGKTVYHRGIRGLAELLEATEFSVSANGGGAGMRAEYFENPALGGTPVGTLVVPRVDFNTPGPGAPGPDQATPQWASARWSGYFTPKAAGEYDVFVEAPGENVHYRLLVDGKVIFDAWQHATLGLSAATLALDGSAHRVVLEHFRGATRAGPRLRLGIVARAQEVDPEAVKMAAAAGAAVVAIGFDPDIETEGFDRSFQLPLRQEELIRQIAAVNKNTVVVITSGGAVDMRGWLERVPAVLEAWYPGQEGGRALAEILFGEVNPSGRLPVTIENAEEDNPTLDSYYPEGDTKRVTYKEGIFVGYRGYVKSGRHPLFPFGYGLSYTQFEFRNLKVAKGVDELHFEVSCDVVNMGRRAGSEVAEVYVSRKSDDPHLPVPELKGFARVSLRPGETQRVTVTLGPRAFAYYDVESSNWRIDAGEAEISVGDSAEHAPLSAKVNFQKSATTKAAPGG